MLTVGRTCGETTNTLIHLMLLYYTERRPKHDLMYTVDHILGYCNKKFIRACAKSSPHAHGTEIKGGNFIHSETTKRQGLGWWATDSQGLKWKPGSDPRTGTFHQTQVTVGDTIMWKGYNQNKVLDETLNKSFNQSMFVKLIERARKHLWGADLVWSGSSSGYKKYHLPFAMDVPFANVTPPPPPCNWHSPNWKIEAQGWPFIKVLEVVWSATGDRTQWQRTAILSGHPSHYVS